jgi:hypothetical protein
MMQFRNHSRLDINISSNDEFYGLFSSFDPDTFKSVLSNLINNAAEALNFKGSINITCRKNLSNLYLGISNGGPHIPEMIRSNLFEKGFTTKSNGNGLGLYSAKKAIEAIGGSINITFEPETLIEINVPVDISPSHFPENLNFTTTNNIYILDDDLNVHNIWKRKFANIKGIEIHHFYSVESFLEVKSEISDSDFLLTDFEFVGHVLNGLDCLRELNFPNNSLLVTALSNEAVIQKKLSTHRFKVLPKSMILDIPVKLNNRTNNLRVLIDDDKLTHYIWKKRAAEKNITLSTYFSIDEFLKNSNSHPLDTTIYIDSDLGNGSKGEVESEAIFNLGYKKLYLATGYEPSNFSEINWILGVFGKNPDLALSIS